MKLIALDMDGVVNSQNHILDWFENKFKELRSAGFEDKHEVLFKEAKKHFSKEFCTSEELVFPDLAERIMRICMETDAKILWTTTWRKIGTYRDDITVAQKMFDRRGLPGDRLIGYTPDFASGRFSNSSCRGSEIRAWLLNNEFETITHCAVIDDSDDAGYMLPKNAQFFQTDIAHGITEKLTEDIIKYLNDLEH